MVSLYVSTIYGILCEYRCRLSQSSKLIRYLDLMLATIPYVFQDIYHFETQYTGLAYLGRKFISLNYTLSINAADVNLQLVLACL
jgi:hypothetical protein